MARTSSGGKREHEICRKPAGIPLDGLVQGFGRRSIEFCQIGVQNDPLAPDEEDSGLNLLHEKQ
jgi:hypothetical protein